MTNVGSSFMWLSTLVMFGVDRVCYCGVVTHTVQPRHLPDRVVKFHTFTLWFSIYSLQNITAL